MATVTKRGNSYLIRASAGYDAQGKQIRRSKTWTPDPGMTPKQIQRELERQKVLFDEEVEAGLHADGSIKFQEFAERWFSEYASSHLRKKTVQEYKRETKRVYPAIGHIRLEKLRPQHLMKFYAQLASTTDCGAIRYEARNLRAMRQATGLSVSDFAQRAQIGVTTVKSLESGKSCMYGTAERISAVLDKPIEKIFKQVRAGGHLSPKTIHSYHEFISSVLERAVKWQLIKDNPCRRVDPPKVPKHEIQVLDDQQAAKLLEQLQNEPLEDQTFFTLALYTGARRGELLGLEWPDIDFNTGVLSIRRTSQYEAGVGMYEDTTKTERSKRSIRVTEGVLKLLRAYRAYQSTRRLTLGDQWFNGWEVHPRLFTNRDGKPMNASTPLNRLKRILRRAGLPEVSLHSLRHTSATLLIGQGIDVRTVSGRLGHSQTSTTLNIYAHEFQSADAAAAEALEIALTRKKA